MKYLNFRRAGVFTLELIVIICILTVVRTPADTLDDEIIGIGEDDFKDIQDALDDAGVGDKIDFAQYVSQIKDNGTINIDEIVNDIGTYMGDELAKGKRTFIILFTCALLSGACLPFFRGNIIGKMSDAGSYIAYMIICTTLIAIYSESLETAKDTISNIRSFMTTVIPTYTAVTAFVTGSFTASGYSSLALILVASVNVLLLTLLLPLSRIYMIVNVTGNMMDENRFTRLLGLIVSFSSFVTKSLILLVCTMSVFQKMLLPYQDMAKRQAVFSAIKTIPVAGKSVSGLTDLVFASAMLIRNSIGLSVMIALIVILSVPVIKLLLALALFNVTAALIEPIADKKISKVIAGGAKAISILIMAMLTSAGLFLISLAFTGIGG